MKFLHAIVVFFTISLALAQQFFAQLGFHASYTEIGLLGIAVTTLLIFRAMLPVVSVAVLALLVSQPDSLLQAWHLDRQVLQAAAATVVLFPWIKRFLIDA